MTQDSRCTLAHLAADTGLERWNPSGNETPGKADAAAPVLGVTDDSRDIRPGWLHVVRPGAKGSTGIEHVPAAIAAGAVAIAVPRTVIGALGEEAQRVPIYLYQEPVQATAAIADSFWGHPARRLQLVGVTGTNGKTTIAMLYRQLALAGGMKCGLLGTVVTDDGSGPVESALTTPGRMALTATFARMVANGCSAAAMEVSSHALAQGRVFGVDFGTAIFTNLTGDHLDFHGTMEAYADAKALLFEGLADNATAIVNKDDAAHTRMIRSCRARVLRCSIVDRSAECFAEVRAIGLHGMDVSLHGPWGLLEARVPLLGKHNAMNVLQAVAAAWSTGVRARAIETALQTCQAPPGRLQPASGPADDIGVFVDYAHTDDALENVLNACRGCVAEGASLTVVFGCGGDRDRTKRPRMARVACRLADRTFVTSDNPRTEVPESIVAEVMTGVPSESAPRVRAVVDRAEAIRAAIHESRPGDLVVIAGKGHENYQIIGTTKRPFDDRQEAMTALASRRAGRRMA